MFLSPFRAPLRRGIPRTSRIADPSAYSVQAFHQSYNCRIGDSLYFQQPREQTGLRKGHSTRDQIHVVNKVIEKSAEYNKTLYMAFIHYEKALKDEAIEETYIRLLEDVYKKCTSRITLHKQSDKFPIRKAVRQEGTTTQKLFKSSLEGY